MSTVFNARAEAGRTPPARRLVRPASRSTIFFPLVVLAAVLPGLYALNWWNLTPPGPWWGLRGLAVLDGYWLDQVPATSTLGATSEAQAFRAVALQPPLYAWLEALGLALGFDRAPLATVIPSYLAGVALVLLAYWHGQLWRGSGVGLVAALLTAFNPHLLIQMKVASPATLAVAATLTAMYAYGRHFRVGGFDFRGGGRGWVVVGGLALGVTLLAMGPVGLLCVPVVLLHQFYLRSDLGFAERQDRPWYGWWNNASLVAGAIALGIALLIATPWFAWMAGHHGRGFAAGLLSPPDPLGWDRPGLLARLNDLAPASLPLALFALIRAVRTALVSERDDRPTIGSIFWTLWLVVAALAPAIWADGPQTALGLFLLVPLNLLAAQAIADLTARRASVRNLGWLAPLTVVSVGWWLSGDLRNAVLGLMRGHVGPRSALGLHLAVDLLILVVVLARALARWARPYATRQRRFLAGFLVVVVVTTLADGVREVTFRHVETRELMNLRASILLRHQARAFRGVAVVGPDGANASGSGPTPGGRLRFLLRSTLPGVEAIDLATTDQLRNLADSDGPYLVILIGPEQRLSYAMQSQLGLESIHTSQVGQPGLLDAFATPGTRQSRPVASVDSAPSRTR